MEKLREILQQAGSLLEAEKSEDALKLLDSAPEELKKQSQFQYAKGSLHLHNQNVEAAIVGHHLICDLDHAMITNVIDMPKESFS